MKKHWKIVGIALGLAVLAVFISSSGSWQGNQKLSKAQALADKIIAELGEFSSNDYFTHKYFDGDKVLGPTLWGIRRKCDWANRDGVFVDYFEKQDSAGVGEIAFIYEYYLKCDSLRFVLTVNTADEPVLSDFYVEPLEYHNGLIKDWKKQLKNRKKQ
ncbi:MAG: hypothetical protein IT258_08980 [Saprospiraceae bacterium]|nr:hypothetical protein [Saprospiraceae bacterium]